MSYCPSQTVSHPFVTSVRPISVAHSLYEHGLGDEHRIFLFHMLLDVVSSAYSVI